jgi:hypothetical protein
VPTRLLKIGEKLKEKGARENNLRVASVLRGIVLPWGVRSGMIRFIQETPSESFVRGESV